MARTELSVQTTAKAGITPSYSAATVDGFAVYNKDGKTFLHVKNTGGSSCTVTVGQAKTIDTRTLPALTFTVGATSGDKIIGPFDPALYNETFTTPALSNAFRVDFSVQSGVTCAALKLGST